MWESVRVCVCVCICRAVFKCLSHLSVALQYPCTRERVCLCASIRIWCLCVNHSIHPVVSFAPNQCNFLSYRTDEHANVCVFVRLCVREQFNILYVSVSISACFFFIFSSLPDSRYQWKVSLLARGLKYPAFYFRSLSPPIENVLVNEITTGCIESVPIHFFFCNNKKRGRSRRRRRRRGSFCHNTRIFVYVRLFACEWDWGASVGETKKKTHRNHVVDSIDDFLFNYSLGELFGEFSKSADNWRKWTGNEDTVYMAYGYGDRHRVEDT